MESRDIFDLTFGLSHILFSTFIAFDSQKFVWLVLFLQEIFSALSCIHFLILDHHIPHMAFTLTAFVGIVLSLRQISLIFGSESGV